MRAIDLALRLSGLIAYASDSLLRKCWVMYLSIAVTANAAMNFHHALTSHLLQIDRSTSATSVVLVYYIRPSVWNNPKIEHSIAVRSNDGEARPAALVSRSSCWQAWAIHPALAHHGSVPVASADLVYLVHDRLMSPSLPTQRCDGQRCCLQRPRIADDYLLNSKYLHNHRYLPFHYKIIPNQPTVKRPSLNKEDLSNYRPIANLSFISKLTEKIVKKRLLDHLTSNLCSTPFNLPIPNSTLPRLHYFPYMTIFLMLSPCNKSPAFVFLISQLPLLLSTTSSSFHLVRHFLCFITMVHFISLIPHIYCRDPSTQFPFIPSYLWSSTRLRSRPSSFQSLYHLS